MHYAKLKSIANNEIHAGGLRMRRIPFVLGKIMTTYSWANE
jgi:hypothetical protein